MDAVTELHLIRRALDALRPFGIQGRLLSTEPADGSVDAYVELSRGDRGEMFAASARRVVRPSTVALVVDQIRALDTPHPPLLVAEQVSPETAQLLHDRGVQFIDTAGNAYVDTPSLLVAITGRRAAEVTSARSRDRIGRAALQVAFVLLRDHHAAGLSVRALGDLAGVSHGAAASALHAFDARGWIRHLGRDGHRVVDPEGMLSAWLFGFSDQLAPKLEIGRATSPGVTRPASWARGILDQLSPERGLLGGEAAAELTGHDIHGSTAAVYVCSWDAETMKRLRLAPAREGTISVRSAFAQEMHDPADPRMVDPLIVLGDIASIPDERLDETRAALQRAVIARFAT